MELAEVSTADGMLGSTNDTKASWEDEDSQPKSTYPARKGCSMNVEEEKYGDDGQITTSSLSLLDARDGKCQPQVLQAFWFNDWVKSLSLCQEASDLSIGWVALTDKSFQGFSLGEANVHESDLFKENAVSITRLNILAPKIS